MEKPSTDKPVIKIWAAGKDCMLYAEDKESIKLALTVKGMPKILQKDYMQYYKHSKVFAWQIAFPKKFKKQVERKLKIVSK